VTPVGACPDGTVKQPHALPVLSGIDVRHPRPTQALILTPNRANWHCRLQEAFQNAMRRICAGFSVLATVRRLRPSRPPVQKHWERGCPRGRRDPGRLTPAPYCGRGCIKVENMRFLVLDEADEKCSNGFCGTDLMLYSKQNSPTNTQKARCFLPRPLPTGVRFTVARKAYLREPKGKFSALPTSWR